MRAFLLLLALAAPSLAQETPAAPGAPPGPGDPLPPLSLDYRGGTIRYSGTRAIVTDGVLTFGDVRLRAEQIEADRETLALAARGDVVLTRGDETLRGASFAFDPESGRYAAEDAVAISPPFYLSGARIERTPEGGLRARDALFSVCPEGRGEFFLSAREVELVENRSVVLRRPTFHLFGARLITLRSYRYSLRRERRRGVRSLPVHVRTSRIAGPVIGVLLPFTPGRGYEGEVGLDLPARRSPQYTLTLQRDLLPARPAPPAADPAGAESPLRAFLRARPLPPPRDPVLDFEDIGPTENPLEFPTRAPGRELRALVNLWANHEVGNKRSGDLLLSRLPEARVFGILPLARPTPEAADAARAHLRRPRPLLTGDITLGRYEERVLGGERGNTRGERLAVTAGIGMLPLLVGGRLLVRSQLLLAQQSYRGGASYRLAELNLAAGYVLGARAAVGAAYIRRFTAGGTPFVFDLVETQNEAQVRAQTPLFGGRYTLAALGRYDVDERRFFDFELAAALRLRCIEPRLFYRRLGRQIGFSLALPGLTP